MTIPDKRKHSRIRSLNLLSYVCVDQNGEAVMQGMGRTLDVSEGGILLETHAPIDTEYTVSLAIGLEDDLTNINGRAVYSKVGEAGRFECGIEFQEKGEGTPRILKKYIKAFRQKDK